MRPGSTLARAEKAFEVCKIDPKFPPGRRYAAGWYYTRLSLRESGPASLARRRPVSGDSRRPVREAFGDQPGGLHGGKCLPAAKRVWLFPPFGTRIGGPVLCWPKVTAPSSTGRKLAPGKMPSSGEFRWAIRAAQRRVGASSGKRVGKPGRRSGRPYRRCFPRPRAPAEFWDLLGSRSLLHRAKPIHTMANTGLRIHCASCLSTTSLVEGRSVGSPRGRKIQPGREDDLPRRGQSKFPGRLSGRGARDPAGSVVACAQQASD